MAIVRGEAEQYAQAMFHFAAAVAASWIALLGGVQPTADHSASWTTRAAEHVAAAKKSALDTAVERGIELPPDFLAWIDADPVRRDSVYGCRSNPLPVLLGLRSLEIDLGEEVVRRQFPQLALAFAIQDSYAPRDVKAGGWNDADSVGKVVALPDVSARAPLTLTIQTDPRTPVNTHDTGRTLDRDDHIINFLEDHAPISVETSVRELPPLEYDERGIAKPRGKPTTVTRMVERGLFAADVIESASLQREFNEYMQAHGQDFRIDCGDRAVAWNATEAISDGDLRKRIAAAHEAFHAAYRAKGRMPQERDRAPTASESMAWFVRNDVSPPVASSEAGAHWPRFPLNAPWPVLIMLAADDQPLREREEIWQKFVDTGEARTYGEYIGGIAQQGDMQSARRLAPFAFSYGSIQMMWKDGGVCGTMGNIGARTERILGVPASTAGQPGHCAMVKMDFAEKTGEFSCQGGQYATGGDEVTTVHAGWNYDDVGGRRPMIFHQSVAWGVNEGVDAFVDTLVMRRAFDALSPSERAAECRSFLTQGLKRNPYAMVVAEAAIAAAPDPAMAVRLLDDFNKSLDAAKIPKQRDLYRNMVADLAHARVMALPAPTAKDDAAALLGELARQKCTNAPLLAKLWRATAGEDGFVAKCVESAKAYIASPERTKNRKAADAFVTQLRAWARTISNKNARVLWAKEVLGAFEGQDSIEIRGKKQIDPAVAALRKFADLSDEKK